MSAMTKDQMIEWIDKASLAELLHRWRFGAIGDPFFQGEVGQHYDATMKAKRRAEGPEAWTAASKQVGW